MADSARQEGCDQGTHRKVLVKLRKESMVQKVGRDASLALPPVPDLCSR